MTRETDLILDLRGRGVAGTSGPGDGNNKQDEHGEGEQRNQTPGERQMHTVSPEIRNAFPPGSGKAIITLARLPKQNQEWLTRTGEPFD
jgi:hypothetical protein